MVNEQIVLFLEDDYFLETFTKMPSSEKGIRGVCLVRMEDGTERIVPRANYMRMKKTGRNVTLLKEGLRWKDLGSWDPAVNHPRGPTTKNPYPAIRSLLKQP